MLSVLRAHPLPSPIFVALVGLMAGSGWALYERGLGLPLLYLFAGGIGLPGGAVYIRDAALRGNAWRSLISAAGPLATATFHLAVIWPLFVSQFAQSAEAGQRLPFWASLAFLGTLEVTAPVFNLLPVPGLDGYGIIAPYLPSSIRRSVERFGGWSLWLIILILWSYPPAASAFWTSITATAALLHIPPGLGDLGRGLFQSVWRVW